MLADSAFVRDPLYDKQPDSHLKGTSYGHADPTLPLLLR